MTLFASRLVAGTLGLALAMLSSLPARAQAVDPITYAFVIATLAHDWNGDGALDRVVLVETQKGVDLHLFLGQSPDSAMTTYWVYTPSIATIDSRVPSGMPSLAINGEGLLEITSRLDADAKLVDTTILRVAYENDIFSVVGYERETADLNPASLSSWSCKIDLRTGIGEIDGKMAGTSMRLVPLDQWSMERVPAECTPPDAK